MSSGVIRARKSGFRSPGRPIDMPRAFTRYIGIDYSGAQTPTSSLKGLRVYEADVETVSHEVQRLAVRENTGLAKVSPSGWRPIWQTDRQLWSESITRSHFRCATLSSMAYRLVGCSFLRTSCNIGLRTKITHTSNSFAMAPAATAAPVGVIHAGAESPNCERALPSQYFNLTSRDRSPSPRMPVSHGCDTSAAISAGRFIFGHSTAGPSRPILP